MWTLTWFALAVLAGLFKGSYDPERRVCDLERLDRPTKAGWDGISGVRWWKGTGISSSTFYSNLFLARKPTTIFLCCRLCSQHEDALAQAAFEEARRRTRDFEDRERSHREDLEVRDEGSTTIYLKYRLYLEIFLSLAKPVPNDSVVVNKTKKPLCSSFTHAGLSVMLQQQCSEHKLQLWKSQQSLTCNYFLWCILVWKRELKGKKALFYVTDWLCRTAQSKQHHHHSLLVVHFLVCNKSAHWKWFWSSAEFSHRCFQTLKVEKYQSALKVEMY